MPAMGRQLGRLPAALQGKMLAPRNGGTRLCRQWGANSASDRLPFPIFSALGRRGLGAQIPAKPCSFVPFAPSLQAFSALGRRRLGAQIPAKPCSFVPFAPSLRTFSALGRHGLGAQTPARPCSFVPFAPSLRTFSALGRRLESRKGEWPRPFSFSSFPQSKASGGTPEAHELLFLCSISIQSISIS